MNVENIVVLFLGDCRPAEFGVIKGEEITKIQKKIDGPKREVQRKVKRHTARRNRIKKERDSPSGRKPTVPLRSSNYPLTHQWYMYTVLPFQIWHLGTN